MGKDREIGRQVQMKILLVEDSRVQRRMLAKILSANHCQVVEATNGREGLESFRGDQPDLIISDVMMPVMDGFAFLRQLRQEEHGKKIPFVFYSAVFIGQKDKDLAFKLGASRFLVKPTEPKNFIKEIKSLLEEYQRGLLKPAQAELEAEKDYYRYYSERIIRKLEQKVSELEQEIVEHNQTEAALRASEKRYRTLLEQASDAIFTLSIGGKILSVNKRGYELFGYSKDELLQMSIENLLPPSEKTDGNMLPIDALKARKTILTERIMSRQDGSLVPVEVSGVMLDDGRVQEIIRNITERKQAEELTRDKELNIRKAYADALSAVTGGRLVFLTSEEMRTILGEPLMKKMTLSSYHDLTTARSKLKKIINEQIPNTQAAVDLVLAANEATTNAIKHGEKGDVEIFKKGDTMQVLISDQGPGVDFSILPAATLKRGFSTKHSLGLGFGIMLDTCERVLLSTQPGQTMVLLEMERYKKAKTVDKNFPQAI